MKEDINNTTKLEDQLVFQCFKGNYLKVKQILELGVSPNCQSLLETTPLNAATSYGHYKIIDLLLANGADINFESDEILSFSRTPLSIACYKGDIKLAKYLLDHGADINLMSGLYGNPLHAAISSGNLELVNFLIDNGASVEAKQGVYLDTPLCAAVRIGNIEMVNLLIEKKAKIKPIRKMARKDIGSNMVKFLKSKGYL